MLAMQLAGAESTERNGAICSGFNFGPDPTANRPVRDLVEQVLECWPGEWIDGTQPDAPHEAGLLNLTIEKADRWLDWRPAWSFEEAIRETVDWYRAVNENEQAARSATHRQIRTYMDALDSSSVV